MNVGMITGYNANNIKQRPSFGMAMTIEGKAQRAIKKELAGCPEEVVKNFWAAVKDITTRQESNPVNIIIKDSMRGLYAQVEDNGSNAVKAIKVRRGLFEGKGNFAFMERAEHQADMINTSNKALNPTP